MKKLLTFIAIVAVSIAMVCVSCNYAKSQLKYYDNGEAGWEYISKNYEDYKEIRLNRTIVISNAELTNDTYYKDYEGISINKYYVSKNKNEYVLYVFFKYGEPRYVCEKRELSEKYFGMILFAAWDDRSEFEIERENADMKTAWWWIERLNLYKALQGL